MRETIAAVVIASTILFVCAAYRCGYAEAEKEFERQAAIAAAKQGAKDYERLRKATENFELARSDLDAARDESRRLRDVLTRRGANTARATPAKGDAGCESLLRDGVELLGSCRERLLECAMKHDALVDLTK